jgi:hypothetical protein
MPDAGVAHHDGVRAWLLASVQIGAELKLTANTVHTQVLLSMKQFTVIYCVQPL